MTRNATGSSNLARTRLALAGTASAMLAACASAPDGARPASLVGGGPTATDVALTPVTDLNLRRDPIPPILLQAREGPYAVVNTRSCASIALEMGMLNAVLGEDYDTGAIPERTVTPEKVAQQVIAYFIPFRGVIREVSGANRHEWEFRQAISAGLMRRAYLKGRGEEMGCAYPARPYPSKAVSDPANFEDLGDPPPEPRDDPRRIANVEQ